MHVLYIYEKEEGRGGVHLPGVARLEDVPLDELLGLGALAHPCPRLRGLWPPEPAPPSSGKCRAGRGRGGGGV
jgi:hypothetical protein